MEQGDKSDHKRREVDCYTQPIRDCFPVGPSKKGTGAVFGHLAPLSIELSVPAQDALVSAHICAKRYPYLPL